MAAGDRDVPVRIQIQHVPDCARLGQARAIVDRALSETGVVATVEEIVGEYASPTILVNEVDVTGRTAGEVSASCRLDLPTEAQMHAALTAAANRTEASG
jgi:hypothetical protein